MDTKRKVQVEFVNKTKISCNGGPEKFTGHPLIYLQIDSDKKEIKCPYCSKKFIFKEE